MGGHSGASTPARSPEVLAAVPVATDVTLAVGAAFAAAGSAAPFIMTVDKAVTLAATGQIRLGTAILRGLADLLRPHIVARSPAIWMVAGVYGATYATANLIDVAAERRSATPTQHSVVKLVGTTAVNMSSSIAKDVAFAKMFGKDQGAAAAMQRTVPLATYSTFLFRDCFTIGAGFILPPLVASGLRSYADMDSKTAEKTAQLVTPVAMQCICTPLHLLGLNIYNEPVATLRERAAGVWRTCPECTAVRMSRFLFAYGFGGILNKELVTRGRAWASEQYCRNDTTRKRGLCGAAMTPALATS